MPKCTDMAVEEDERKEGLIMYNKIMLKLQLEHRTRVIIVQNEEEKAEWLPGPLLRIQLSEGE